jgi:hypothetical protein
MKQEDIIRIAREYANEVTNNYGIVFYEFDLYGLEKFVQTLLTEEHHDKS